MWKLPTLVTSLILLASIGHAQAQQPYMNVNQIAPAIPPDEAMARIRARDAARPKAQAVKQAPTGGSPQPGSTGRPARTGP